jgi:hypothetical protein
MGTWAKVHGKRLGKHLSLRGNRMDRKADARNRAGRTLLQGAAATVLVAVLQAVTAALSDGETDWKAIAWTAGGAALMAGFAYSQRAWLDGGT